MRLSSSALALAIGYKRDPWQLQLPRKSASCEIAFRRLICSLSLRPFWLLGPRADQAWRASQLPASQDVYFRAFRTLGHPMCLPDMTTASN